MRVTLLNPTYWPEVRRGSERLAHDLGVALAGRGHRVRLITAHPGAREVAIEDGVEVVRGRRWPEVPGLTWYYDEHLTAAPSTLLELARDDADVVHALYPTDGWAANIARGRGGAPYVFSVHGIINRQWLVRRRRRLDMLRQAAAGAAVVTALSDAGAQPLRRFALADPAILPGGVVCADYEGDAITPERPVLLCPASLDDPRKRGALLVEAAELVRERRPDVTLKLAGGRDPRQSEPVEIAAAGDWIQRASIDSTAGLARAYREASVTVLPSDDEAFGLVLLESLASGTPVVASRAGGCVEIVTDDAVGRLFEPGDPRDLARAIGEALDLATDPATATACRRHAADWDWARVVERYEEVYGRALG
jgi:glycosyltransferase involved in cell wall biosynthesis